jgi:hypothetical protein
MLQKAMQLLRLSTASAPSLHEVVAEMDKTKYTPDISRLEEQEYHLLFVCDELKKDHAKHDLLGMDAEYLFPAYTRSVYQFWQSDDPTVSPVPMKSGDKASIVRYFPKPAKIKGELYAVRSQQFLLLDNYKQNTVEFRRQKIMVIVPYRTVVWLKDHSLDPAFGPLVNAIQGERYTGKSIKTTKEKVHLLRVWMYIGRSKHWNPLLTAYDFKPVEVFQSRNRPWCPNYSYIRRPDQK